MAIRIPDSLIELLLFGPRDDRRQLQESPILGDVWFAYANAPDKAVDLLIAPYKGVHAGKVGGAFTMLCRRIRGARRRLRFCRGSWRDG